MKVLASIFAFFSILVGLVSCNNDNNSVEIPLDGDTGPMFFIYLSFIDNEGHDIVETIEKTPLTLEMSNYQCVSDSATYLKLEDYQMDTYLDGKFVEPASPFEYNFVNCMFGKYCINGLSSITLVATGSELQLKKLIKSLDDLNDFDKHSIEWHFECPKLFGDNKEHILKLDFELIDSNAIGAGFKGAFYFDGIQQTLYYPKTYDLSPEYSAVEGWEPSVPYCIVQL